MKLQNRLRVAILFVHIYLYMGFSSFRYQTTRITESVVVVGLILHGNEAVPFNTAFTVMEGPENKNAREINSKNSIKMSTLPQ